MSLCDVSKKSGNGEIQTNKNKRHGCYIAYRLSSLIRRWVRHFPKTVNWQSHTPTSISSSIAFLHSKKVNRLSSTRRYKCNKSNIFFTLIQNAQLSATNESARPSLTITRKTIGGFILPNFLDKVKSFQLNISTAKSLTARLGCWFHESWRWWQPEVEWRCWNA